MASSSAAGDHQDTRKTVLITGAGIGGIGGELARRFHAHGYRVFAAVRRLETVEELERTLGIEGVCMDVTAPESIAAARATVAARTGGRLNVLVNNAGQSVPRPATDLEVETTVKRIFDVNVFGVMRVNQVFADLLIAAAAADDEAMIVNIGSIAPIVSFAFGAAYNASKAALHAYADCLRMELKPFGVHVLTVITGGVRSNIVRQVDPELPPNSLYQPIHDFWLRRVRVSQEESPMDTTVYAESVVRQVVARTRKPWFWQGSFAWIAWTIDTFLWRGFADYGMSKRFGLFKLADLVRESRRGAAKIKPT